MRRQTANTGCSVVNSKFCCRGCRAYYSMDEAINLQGGRFHSIQCAIDYGLKKAAKIKQQEIGAAKKAFKSENETLSQAVKKAQVAFNKYIRLRDHDQPCISCSDTVEDVEADQGHLVGGCWDAGHYKTRAARPQLRFNTFNVHKQCKKCNGGSNHSAKKEDTVSELYENNLRAKFGEEKVDWLNNNHDTANFTKEYCRRLAKIFNKRARLIKKRIGA